MRTALLLGSTILAVGLSACGGDDPPEQLTRQEVVRVVTEESGRKASCSTRVIAERVSDNAEVWIRKVAGKEACWEIDFKGSTPYTVDPASFARQETVGWLIGACPEYLGNDPEPPVDRSPESSSPQPRARVVAPDPNGPEGDFATIESGSRPSADDATLISISSLLDAMEVDCPKNTRTQLADFTANAYERLNGVATPREILRDVSLSTDLGAFSDCLDVFVQYVLLREGGG